MKDQIFHKALELFLKNGMKTTTMDDIAFEMGISKKTIYQHYESKNRLIEEVLVYINDLIISEIHLVFDKNNNAIIELLSIHNSISDVLNINSISFQAELSRYYPRLYQKQKKVIIKKTLHFIEKNLAKGVKEGDYKDDIDIEFLARFFVASCYLLDDVELFPLDQFESSYLYQSRIQYYIEAISTDVGLEEFIKVRKTYTQV
ncbi:hypothetical protein AV926_16070 [Myroides marinus]|uniref:HTH tetR-type domain-containing protein n=1 Tax=Myroides marinus TaxID=703342 RepID=A0A163WCF9_9FLAO|nr:MULTISPECIES: TetR/AcrR family transcriptional regulator [Myroides]KZE76161.1 hypothetical protein AV926_16070 [Myroides marinus]MDM1036216.1 TetR/AcrR family transcriptional regulator [Myroides odoratimimus]